MAQVRFIFMFYLFIFYIRPFSIIFVSPITVISSSYLSFHIVVIISSAFTKLSVSFAWLSIHRIQYSFSTWQTPSPNSFAQVIVSTFLLNYPSSIPTMSTSLSRWSIWHCISQRRNPVGTLSRTSYTKQRFVCNALNFGRCKCAPFQVLHL